MKGSASRRLVSIGLLASLAVAAAGFWGPWVSHRAAALVVIGQDLGELVKFLPEVRSGQLAIVRQFLYLPPFGACVILALLAGSRWVRYPTGVRLALLAAIFPLSLALLPPVFSVPVLRSGEFRVQVIGMVVCWMMVPLSFILACLPARVWGSCLAAVSLSAAVLPLWQFARVLPAIARVYDAPTRIGWGPFATGLGFLSLAVLGLLFAARRAPAPGAGESAERLQAARG